MDRPAHWWQLCRVPESVPPEKLQKLDSLLRDLQSCLVAYSGGVDSAFLAVKAHEILGDRALAVIADSPSLPRRELAEAEELARNRSFPLKIVRTEEFSRAEYTSNPVNRCYFCKHELFSTLIPLAREGGFQSVIYGENASDLADVRPGAEAAKLFQIRAPLKEAGLDKNEIRQFSRELGLPTADKPQLACLSSRIPHGQAVSVEKLAMVEQAEEILRQRGFYDVRVRHLEEDGIIRARIEVGVTEVPRLHEVFPAVEAVITRLGYQSVVIDPRGYRRPGG